MCLAKTFSVDSQNRNSLDFFRFNYTLFLCVFFCLSYFKYSKERKQNLDHIQKFGQVFSIEYGNQPEKSVVFFLVLIE